ncbi:hypothetical protein QEH59_15390 [Coraliomargarita sp. SDUM461004]|uniref:Lipid/polyisoprenoid-binding YceI-like domain-containing protein n=1 Tax=Thalassobacterium sedimentorum TaxID=3041258 RepID=A0ABU1APY4_9BACT|nr:type VI secretion system tube protein Hcp [Coraliomargarita sp. SDUM461004]MDQ8195816.1 hypothetical protein [Coraliomargarita sp. SDUM461004]
MKIRTILFSLLCLQFISLAVHAQSSARYFLYTPGSSTESGIFGSTVAEPYSHSKAIEVSSFSFVGERYIDFSAAGNHFSDHEWQDLELILTADTKAYSSLMTHYVSGVDVPKLTLEGVIFGAAPGAASGNWVFMKIEMSQVYVAAVAIEATEGDSLVVNVRLAWKSMKFETSSLDNSATATSNGSTTWNRQTNDTTYP